MAGGGGRQKLPAPQLLLTRAHANLQSPHTTPYHIPRGCIHTPARSLAHARTYTLCPLQEELKAQKEAEETALRKRAKEEARWCRYEEEQARIIMIIIIIIPIIIITTIIIAIIIIVMIILKIIITICSRQYARGQ